jgi:phenylpropionate dioxygenase-like ring-hydroxylating dioxygenase large terminal subunit
MSIASAGQQETRPTSVRPWVVEDTSAGRFDVRRAAFTSDVVSDEMLRVFDKSWVYVGHESEIPNKNDFVARIVAGRPVILVRASDGGVRILQNSCSHRGAEVCRESRGNARLFVCPYHAWTFQNDGLLRGTSFPDGVSKGFDRKRMGLKSPPRVETYRDLIFMSFDRDIADLPTYLGRAKEILDLILDQAELGMELVEGTHEYSIDANWKLLIENSIDGYHAPSTHQRYFDFLNRNAGSVDPGSARFSRGIDLGNGHAVMTGDARFPRPVALWAPMMGEKAKPQIDKVYARLVERFGEDRASQIATRSRNLFIFPNLIINDVQAITVRTFYPVRPNRMSVISWALAPKGESKELRRLRLESYLSFLGPVALQPPMTSSCSKAVSAALPIGRLSGRTYRVA